MADNCPLCDTKMESDGFDHTGYWRVWECPVCSATVQEATVGDTDGMSPADLQRLGEYTDS